MFWADSVVCNLQGKQLINDSKTPSGRAHLGSLRGPVLHDILFRAVQDRGLEAEFWFGSDDFDPLDSIPPYLDAITFSAHLGCPLSNVPSPVQGFGSYGEYFMDEFLTVLREMGVRPQVYRTSELYRAGQLNNEIRLILEHAEDIRRIYQEVSGSRKDICWIPFHAICEKCGKIATTSVFDFDNETVGYKCEKILKYVSGCGFEGRISPFDGGGKLPWKMEWVARWAAFGVTIEGAGKDHCGAGGSHDVAEAVLRHVFGLKPPVCVPYEFFLNEERKMSSSQGVGLSVIESRQLFAPEVMRFLIAKIPPKRVISLNLSNESVPRLFDEYNQSLISTCAENDDETRRRILEFVGVEKNQLELNLYRPKFLHLATLVQSPGVDVRAKAEEDKGEALTDAELRELDRWVGFVKVWLANFASADFRFEVKTEMPEEIGQLSPSQVCLLSAMAHWLASVPKPSSHEIESQIYDLSRELGVGAASAFRAFYLVFLGKPYGPRVGGLLEALNRTVVLDRLRAVGTRTIVDHAG